MLQIAFFNSNTHALQTIEKLQIVQVKIQSISPNV